MNDDTRNLDPMEDGATRLVDPNQTAEAFSLGDYASLGLLDRLELPIEVRFGKLDWELAKVLSIRVGDALPVGPEADDIVTLYVQGRPYATGDLVVVEGRFAFRVREVFTDALPGGM